MKEFRRKNIQPAFKAGASTTSAAIVASPSELWSEDENKNTTPTGFFAQNYLLKGERVRIPKAPRKFTNAIKLGDNSSGNMSGGKRKTRKLRKNKTKKQRKSYRKRF